MNRHAQALGKLSGIRLTPEQRRERARKAGKASAAKMTAQQLQDRAKLASAARWSAARRAAQSRKPSPNAPSA